MLLYRIYHHQLVTIFVILTLPSPGQATNNTNTGLLHDQKIHLEPANNNADRPSCIHQKIDLENTRTPKEEHNFEKTPLYIVIGILAGLNVFVLVALIVMYLEHRRIVKRPIQTLPLVCPRCHEVFSPRFSQSWYPRASIIRCV